MSYKISSPGSPFRNFPLLFLLLLLFCFFSHSFCSPTDFATSTGTEPRRFPTPPKDEDRKEPLRSGRFGWLNPAQLLGLSQAVSSTTILVVAPPLFSFRFFPGSTLAEEHDLQFWDAQQYWTFEQVK